MTPSDQTDDRQAENPYKAPAAVQPSRWLRHPAWNYLNTSPVGFLIGIPVGMLIGVVVAWVLAILALFLSDRYGIGF